MVKLEESRFKINQIDKEIIDLFKERMAVVNEILEYKKENGLEIFDPEREKALLIKNLEYLNDCSLEKYYEIFFKGLVESSKEYQKDNICNTLL